MKITLKIQSLSDIITNSSSEVFCSINSNNPEIKKQIFDLMKNLFPGSDPDMEPTVDIYDEAIEVWLPYDTTSLTFYEAGIEAVLNERFGKENYIIDYGN